MVDRIEIQPWNMATQLQIRNDRDALAL